MILLLLPTYTVVVLAGRLAAVRAPNPIENRPVYYSGCYKIVPNTFGSIIYVPSIDILGLQN